MRDVRGDDPTVADSGSGPEGGDGAASDEVRGRIAGRWEILALVGTGGMGNVYRARDEELGEEVALKVLHRRARAADAAALERFRHEVKLARRVTHVNVARTHDIGHHADTLFLTMELIDGEPLGRRIGRGPLAWRDAVAIARGICAGVGAAHAAGIVHRDLKPDNVMLARDGRVVVTDFGIAATYQLGEGDDVVEVTGTPAWMAPEQLAGAADARSDVYAIGEILWAMIVGTHPWLDPATRRIRVVERVTAPSPRLPRDAAPDAVAAVIDRCLARDPAARFDAAAALGAALADAELAVSAGGGTPRPVPAAARPRDVRVGIEPIRNLGDPADDFVAAGLVEDLADMLGRARGIRVRSLSGVPDAGDRGDLDVIIGGSLRRAGELVRIAVRAVGARDGFQIWSHRFDRRLDEILKVSDDVAREVAVALSATVARTGAGRDVAADQVVVELYLRARQLIEQTWLDDPRPLALYQAALERDPESPIVLAAYATLLARRINANEADVTSVSTEAEAIARRAIAHGASLPEPWVARAVLFYNRGRVVDALRAIRIALDRGPGLAEANDVAGRILLELDLDEALPLLERARWANPRLPNTFLDLVRGHSLRGDWDRVDELLRAPGTESAPAQIMARARMALWRGETPDDLPSELPGLDRMRWVAEIVERALRGRGLPPDAAATWQARIHAMPAGTRFRRFFGQLGAEVALRAGAHDVAWWMIDEAVAQGLLDVVWLDRMPLLAPLRGDARFAAIRAEVAARGAAPLAAWRGPLPDDDGQAW